MQKKSYKKIYNEILVGASLALHNAYETFGTMVIQRTDAFVHAYPSSAPQTKSSALCSSIGLGESSLPRFFCSVVVSDNSAHDTKGNSDFLHICLLHGRKGTFRVQTQNCKSKYCKYICF